MLRGGRYENLPDSNSLSLPNFPTQDYTPLSEVVQPAHLQDLLAIILNQSAQSLPISVIDHSVFDMTKDLLATNINAEEEVKTIEPSTVGCGVEASRNQVQSTDLGDYAL
jgi:predicted RNase H-like nuclease (RuvC/YqgF family)